MTRLSNHTTTTSSGILTNSLLNILTQPENNFNNYSLNNINNYTPTKEIYTNNFHNNNSTTTATTLETVTTTQQQDVCSNESLKTALFLVIILTLLITYLSCRMRFYIFLLQQYTYFLAWKEEKQLGEDGEINGGNKSGNFTSASDRSSANSLNCNHSMASSTHSDFNCARSLLVNQKRKQRKEAVYNLNKIFSATSFARVPIAPGAVVAKQEVVARVPLALEAVVVKQAVFGEP